MSVEMLVRRRQLDAGRNGDSAGGMAAGESFCRISNISSDTSMSAGSSTNNGINSGTGNGTKSYTNSAAAMNNINSSSKAALVRRIREKLIESYSVDRINSMDKFNTVKNAAWALIEEETQYSHSGSYLDSYDRAEIFELLVQTMFGYGILDPLIKDNSVTEIMVNGLDKVFVERSGIIEQAVDRRGEPLRFGSRDELLYIIEKIVAPINRKVDESNPIVDARLPNGFRVNIVLDPISLDGHVITIRKFPENPYTMDSLAKLGMLPEDLCKFLKALVEARYNIIISGGTGSGKTTMLNALSNYISKGTRIITIEDAAELKLDNLDNLVRLETRPPNIEGKGEITMRELVRTALRMRPDRIIVGEVRGGEALDMLQAMNTGHEGSLSTGHANSSIDMLRRLETMVLMAGIELPLLSIRQQIASAVDIIIHLGRLHTGERKVMQVVEVIGADGQQYETQVLFEYRKDVVQGTGSLQYTGAQLKNTGKLLLAGIEPETLYEIL